MLNAMIEALENHCDAISYFFDDPGISGMDNNLMITIRCQNTAYGRITGMR